MEKSSLAVLAVCVCLSLMAVGISIFRQPIQTIQQIENKAENKSWHYNAQKSLFGTGSLDTSLQIDSEIWLVYWSAETKNSNGQFYMWIYDENSMLVVRDAWYNIVSGLGAGGGTHTVIGKGIFRVSVIPSELDNWALWIYEYY